MRKMSKTRWLAVLIVPIMLLSMAPVVGGAQETITVGNYAFVPNSGEASISKVDLTSMEEVARYYSAPRLGDEINLVGEPTPGVPNTINPYNWRTSRIALDEGGNAWVINTGADGTGLQGSLVRVLAEPEEGMTTHEYPDPVLTFGTDDAVSVFPVGNPGNMPRAIAIDSDGYIWVGFYGSAQLMKYEFDEAANTLTSVGGPYGAGLNIRYYEMKFDSQDVLYISSRNSTPNLSPRDTGVFSFDGSTFTKEWNVDSPYSLLIGADDQVYATSYSSVLWIKGTGTVAINGAQNLRGMSFDGSGRIWIASTTAASGGNRICWYDPTPLASPASGYITLAVGNTPVGVGFDADNTGWAICRTDNQAQGFIEAFDPDVLSGTNSLGSVRVGFRPYAYGDFAQTVQTASLGDFVWNDMNRNGIQDVGEPGIPDVVVNLYDCGGILLADTATDENGYYLFSGLRAGCYVVEFVLPENGWYFTLQNQGADDAVDSDADRTTGLTQQITLDWGQDDMTWDAGMYQLDRTRSDDTVWAFGGTENNGVLGNESNAWGWTNLISGVGTYEYDLWAGAGQNDTTKGTKVGTVTVVYDGDCVTVTYAVNAPYALCEVHLWIGDTELPMVPKGKKKVLTPTSAPGQFPYTPEISADGLSATYQKCGVTAPFWVSAHGVVEWWTYE